MHCGGERNGGERSCGEMCFLVVVNAANTFSYLPTRPSQSSVSNRDQRVMKRAVVNTDAPSSIVFPPKDTSSTRPLSYGGGNVQIHCLVSLRTKNYQLGENIIFNFLGFFFFSERSPDVCFLTISAGICLKLRYLQLSQWAVCLIFSVGWLSL